MVHGDNLYSLLAQGICYPIQLKNNGSADTNYWSGFVKVKCQPLHNSMIFNVKDIRRKVILYPSCHDNLLTVVDYICDI
jgi:hypothetical protein